MCTKACRKIHGKDRQDEFSSAKGLLRHVLGPRIGDIASLEDEQEKAQAELKGAYTRQSKELKRQEEKNQYYEKLKFAEEHAEMVDSPEMRKRYGVRAPSDVIDPNSTSRLADLSLADVGKSINFSARIHHVRSMSSKLAFVLFRQGLDTIQGVLAYQDGVVSEEFVRWVEHLKAEGLVHVEGSVRRAPESVHSSTIHDIEILIERLHVTVPVEQPLAIDVYGAEREGADDVNAGPTTMDKGHTSDRIIFLRTATMGSIFRVKSGVSSLFRSSLEDRGFIEIHTPKIQPAATESGAEVFSINYFGRRAFLAQSPQLAKQMAIASDFGGVFEVGPVFRAENSNTHRHLTEYIGLDIEMAIQRDYHEVMATIDATLKNIFEGLYRRYRKEIDIVKQRFPHEDLVWLPETLRLTFREAIRLLNESGWKNGDGEPASDLEDLDTPSEIRLGELIKQKYNTDYYIIDKFPASARPFYTKPDAEDERYTNSFDIFLRGQEIASGGQRINDPRELAARLEKAGIDPDSMKEYFHGFELGAPPHGGCGLGLERVVSLLLNLGDVRNASLFPRDPKSMRVDEHHKDRLPYPEADTIKYSFHHLDADARMPTVEELISNYGDAANTSWLDDRYQVWRDEHTGAAVGYAEADGFAIIMGNPLCDPRQYAPVIGSFLREIRFHKGLKPMWLLVSKEVEEILGGRLGWQTLSCVAEERVETDNAKEVTKKQRQAEKAQIKIHEIGLGEPISDALRERIDKRIKDWKANRKGQQVHITEVLPWLDAAHRRYLWAEDKEGNVAGLVVLHRLAPRHGYQIKFALDFPGSPTGSIETLISQAFRSLAAAGADIVTFGTSATPTLTVGQNVHKPRAKAMAWAYKEIAGKLKLIQKSEFREKFGSKLDPVYICYPSGVMGPNGVRTLIKFLGDHM